MKKILFFVSALAGLLLAGSCQQENLEPVAEGNTVTYTVEVPEVATKAIGDGSNVNQLIYAVYRVTGETEEKAKTTLRESELMYQKAVDVSEGKAIVPLELIKDQSYLVLFWAQVENKWFGVDHKFGTAGVRYPSTYVPNSDDYAAFSNVDYISVDGSVKKSITLTRPFGQLNIATNLPDPDLFTPVITGTQVTVEGAANHYDVATGKGTAGTLEFASAAPIAGGFTVYDEYLSMNYVFVPDQQATVSVSYVITTESHGTVENTISNVPVKKNYKTNIVGKLLTSDVDYNVTLEKDWADAGKDMVVLADGVVMNINRDYEVTTETGLAYAINNLFAQGGNFYLTKDVYDISGFEVTPPTIPAGKTLNIYGETPIVTRSASTFAGITIIGLPEVDNTPTLIAEVKNGGSVSVSGVTLDDEGSVLVEKNEGTVVVSEVEADVIVPEGDGNIPPVSADNVGNHDALKTALASGVKVIEITDDITAGKVVFIDRTVTINGNNKTFTTTDTRAFRLIASDIEVTFNDLNIVSSAVRVGTTDIRGVSIDGGTLENISLTLNNCSHDFTDASAHDWTYAVNVVGGTGYKVTIVGGEYEGANVVNVWGTNHTITIDGAVLTSLYQPSSAYYGFCVSLQDAEKSIATIKNSTLNSVHAKAFGGTTKNEFVLENNEDNTQVYPFFIGNAPYLTLNDAFDAAENNTTIYAPFNAEISSSTVPAGKKVTLVLENQYTKYKTQLTGTDESTGSFGLINVGVGADLTITGPGSIKLSATNDREWNAYSSVVSNQRGTLTVNGGAVIEHLGGTDMAYGIDNLTNGKGTSAITTINKATVKSPYRAIRQFLNGVEATNELYVNAEAVIEGGNKSIWMQDPSTNANTGKLVVAEGAELYGDVYLFVTAGSTEWPVSVSITAYTLKDGSEVMTGNVPEGYSVEEKNGVYEVTYKSPAQARLEALINEGGEVALTEDIELSSPIEIKNVTVTLDLKGKTITAPSTSAFEVKAGGELTVKNGKVVAYESTVRAIGGKVIIESGEYTSTGTALDSPATYRYSLDCRDGGELIINGGTFKSNNGMINVGSTVTINGGKFENIVEKSMTRHFAYVSALLTINDGEFYGKANASAGGCFFCGAAAGGNIQVNGGKFTSLWTSGSVNRIFEVYFGGTINVTGGMFNTNGGIATFVTENTDEATKAAYPYVAK